MLMSRELLSKCAFNAILPSGGSTLTRRTEMSGFLFKRIVSVAFTRPPGYVTTTICRAYSKKSPVAEVPVHSFRQRLVRRLMITLGVAGGFTAAGAVYSFKSEEEHNNLTLSRAESAARLKFKPDRRVG